MAHAGKIAAAALRHVTTGGSTLPAELKELSPADRRSVIHQAKQIAASAHSKLDRGKG